MTKNYFTDEQVKQILQKVPTSMHNDPIEEYKSLMNLAVEAAIGEAFGHVISDDGNYEIPLYSVKELEN